MMNRLLALYCIAWLGGCGSTPLRGTPRPTAQAVARGPETCVTFPSPSLPDPPPELPARVCWSEPLPEGEALGECPPTMARVAGGMLSVLAPEHARRTRSIEPFCMDRSEVTVAQYRACVREGACVGPNETVYAVRIDPTLRARHSEFCNATAANRDDHPMNCVSWPQAVAYCAWRYGSHGALPTEDQWAWAARGATEHVYPWGDELPAVEMANRCGARCFHELRHGRFESSEGDGWVTTAPVGRFPRGDSPFAIHDLSGNVAEWTRTPYGQYRYGPDHKLAYHSDDAALRVIRGGAWLHVEEIPLQIDERTWLLLTDRASWVGFRCVVEAE